MTEDTYEPGNDTAALLAAKFRIYEIVLAALISSHPARSEALSAAQDQLNEWRARFPDGLLIKSTAEETIQSIFNADAP